MSDANVKTITPENGNPLVQQDGREYANGQRHNINLHAQKEFFFSIEDWDSVDLDTEDNAVLIGTPKNPIIRPGTKNLIEAPEKGFKTTFSLRLLIGMACGYTVYPSLPVARAVPT
jgi:hypothetical protein